MGNFKGTLQVKWMFDVGNLLQMGPATPVFSTFNFIFTHSCCKIGDIKGIYRFLQCKIPDADGDGLLPGKGI